MFSRCINRNHSGFMIRAIAALFFALPCGGFCAISADGPAFHRELKGVGSLF
jgi:hypothetical protein